MLRLRSEDLAVLTAPLSMTFAVGLVLDGGKAAADFAISPIFPKGRRR
jgi:hypothetical protein